MIRVNLLPGPQKKRKGAAGFRMPNVGDMLTKVRNPLLLGVIGAWAAGVVIVGGLWAFQARQLANLREDRSQIEGEARRFATLIRQKRRAEALRDSLVAELSAIRAIDADRYVWPHLLEEVTKALPDYTWLVSIEAMAPQFAETDDTTVTRPPVRFQIDGRTSDLSAYTRFVSALARSPWIKTAEFGAVQSVIEEERPVSAFTVTVTFRTADSAFIRTVPVQSSVR
ncbi:MAG: PilN domain-containing protein [Gemmatimonadota bacterium]|nr:PilN domain-containing protein [Gemmatimonadota bacterium]